MFPFFSFSHLTAGFIAVLIGFTSSAVLVFQATTIAGASPAEISSWLFALGLSISITCISLSWKYKAPILTGWSTPGAALLVTSLAGVTLPEAIGAFIVASFLALITSVTGIFEKIIEHTPRALTAAMLAGILIQFGLNIFVAMHDQMFLVATMLSAYFIGKRVFPRYVILLVLLLGILIAEFLGLFHLEHLQLKFATPIFTAPVFSIKAIISIAVPLFIVTMTSQNIPGAAVLNASGYNTLPISKLITWTSFVNMLLAPFGCYSICLAAITAAICTSSEADLDPKQRYKSTLFAGLCWLIIGLFGATIVTLFFAFPKPLLTAVTGLALLGTLSSSMQTALDDASHREAALMTFLVSASGVNFYGVGAAFWGLLAGILVSIIMHWKKKESVEVSAT